MKETFSLGDLILSVSSYRKGNGKVVAAVADLLEAGEIKKPRQKKSLDQRREENAVVWEKIQRLRKGLAP